MEAAGACQAPHVQLHRPAAARAPAPPARPSAALPPRAATTCRLACSTTPELGHRLGTGGSGMNSRGPAASALGDAAARARCEPLARAGAGATASCRQRVGASPPQFSLSSAPRRFLRRHPARAPSASRLTTTTCALAACSPCCWAACWPLRRSLRVSGTLGWTGGVSVVRGQTRPAGRPSFWPTRPPPAHSSLRPANWASAQARGWRGAALAAAPTLPPASCRRHRRLCPASLH